MEAKSTRNILDEDVFTILGLENLPQERKDALLGGMIRTVQNRITNRVMRMLSEDDRADLDGILSAGGNDVAVADFLHRKIPNFDQIAAEELARFKLEMVDASGMIDKQVARVAQEKAARK